MPKLSDAMQAFSDLLDYIPRGKKALAFRAAAAVEAAVKRYDLVVDLFAEASGLQEAGRPMDGVELLNRLRQILP